MPSVDLSADRLALGAGGRRWAGIFGVVGIAGLVAAAAIAASTEHGFERLARSYLVNYSFFLSLSLGALFFVLMAHLTRAGWSVVLRRIAEAYSRTLLPMAVLALGVVFSIHDLYEWSHAEEVAADPLLQSKAAYLNQPFFIVRLLIYFALWYFTAAYFHRRSIDQDQSGQARLTGRMELRAAPAMIVFALSLTFASFDLLMSLYPHWYSTIWGVYYFSGSTLGFFSLLAIVMYVLQSRGLATRAISAEHYHDVGKLVFAFVVFWAYIAFSQYMLIWYGNIPEETVWYLERQTGQWTAVSLLLLFGHFVAPFLFLVSRGPKRAKGVLVFAAAWMLIMHWLDLYWIVMPRFSPGVVPLHVQDFVCFVGIGGIFLAAGTWRLSRHALIPVKDPRLEESLGFHNV